MQIKAISMYIWTPLFIIAYKLAWIDWSLWWIVLALFFDIKIKLKREKNGKELGKYPYTSKD